MKKIFSLILALFILISAFSITSFAETKAELTLTSQTVYAGDEFVINLLISDNSKMSGAVIDVNYDKNMLEFVSAEQGAILDSSANVSIRNIDGENAKVRFTYLAPDSSVTSEGIVASFKFKALESASGDADLTVTIPNAGDFVTKDMERISYSVENSVVKIINDNPTVPDDTTETETVAESSSAPTETDAETTTEQNNDKTDNSKNNDTTIVIILAAVGVLIIGVAVVLIVVSKKRKEE